MPFLYLGLALLAGSVLLLEIALTRVFAITMWHHLAYMVISVALLGFGAAGSLLTVTHAASRKESPARSLAWLSSAYGLTVMVAFFLVSRIQVDTLEIWEQKDNVLRLGLTAGVIFLPFLFAGCAIGLVLTRLARHANRLYFWDLVGSAAGGCTSVWFLSNFGSSAAVLFAGLLGTVSGSVFALAAGRATAVKTLVPVALAGAVFGAFVMGPLGETWHVPFAPGKEFARYELDEIERIPSSTAEVEVGPHRNLPPLIGGDFGLRWTRQLKDSGRLLGQDGAAPTMMYKGGGQFADMEFLGQTQAASAYVAHQASGGTDPNVLVIGVGGGADVMVALYHEARRVTAVEINQAMIDVVTDRYDDYLGGLFRPGAHDYSDKIELVHGEGRSFARGTDERFDVIQMSGVDSFTALSTGAYTLSESYLYTTEAVADFYEHLEEGGYINYSRFMLSHPHKPRETMRLANIALSALEELGVEDPASHIAVYRGQVWASTIIKRGPFTAPEIEALDEYASEHGFWGFVFDPLRERVPPADLHVGTERTAQWMLWKSVSDDRIPGLDYTRPQPELAQGLVDAFQVVFKGDEAAVAPILEDLTRHLEGAQRDEVWAAVRARVDQTVQLCHQYDRAFTESQADFFRLMRGSPEERAAFIADYEYDLTACTDDSPFFFNYFRYGNLFKETTKTDFNVSYLSDYPVGHVVLVSSLVQITILAVLLILLPLRWVPRERAPTAARWRVFAYFGALGAGFMFVEIVLMQKMVLFLAHPTYAVSVVLTSILAFAGLGSLIAARLDAGSRRTFAMLAVAVPAVILVEAFLVDDVLTALLGLEFNSRIASVVLILAPLGLILGMPMPLGLRHLEQTWPDLLPWAWAINAFLSVFSSIFCIMVGMALGFSTVLMIGAVVYALGLACLATGRRPTAG